MHIKLVYSDIKIKSPTDINQSDAFVFRWLPHDCIVLQTFSHSFTPTRYNSARAGSNV
jgi:hypothetical protein